MPALSWGRDAEGFEVVKLVNSDQESRPATLPLSPSSVAAFFAPPGDIISIAPHGRGLINDSYLVRRRGGEDFLLQRLNPAVFPQPEMLLGNLRLVSQHLGGKIAATGASTRHQAVRLLPTQQGQDFHYDQEGHCWRALNFIGPSRVLTRIATEEQAGAAGSALGLFHSWLADLPANRLADHLPAFHVTPLVLATYERIAGGRPEPAGAASDYRFCRDFISRRRSSVAVLEQARARGILLERVIHGDPKLTNILFDRTEDRALALIDLDTVKPGLLQYDIGDCLRSCCNRAGEDPGDPAAVEFDLDLARALLAGYCRPMRPLLTRGDLACFYDAARLITFELGLRFFSDYLEGNRYFKADDHEHNLRRALTQFRLTASIENRERQIRLIMTELT